MLKSTFKNNGQSLEEEKSKIIHEKGLPILVSPTFLRDRFVGQCDIVKMEKSGQHKWITIYEVKSSGVIGLTQKKRLYGSCQLLSCLFNCPTFFRILART